MQIVHDRACPVTEREHDPSRTKAFEPFEQVGQKWASRDWCEYFRDVAQNWAQARAEPAREDECVYRLEAAASRRCGGRGAHGGCAYIVL
jgi:hypothetical protein